MANTVKFGLKNCHYAVYQDKGELTFKEPVALPGAVSLSLEPNGEESPFYADDRTYYNVVANQGYTGEFEVAMITEEFEKDILGRNLEDESNVMIENLGDKGQEFALMFEIQGDVKNRRFTLFGCTASRPTTEASTVSESVEPQTDTFSFTAAGLPDGTVRMATTETTPQDVYDKWFDEVRKPGDEVSPVI